MAAQATELASEWRREIITRYREFLTALHAAVAKYYEQGLSDFEMKDKVIADLAAYSKWARFDAFLPRAVSIIYLQVEAEAF